MQRALPLLAINLLPVTCVALFGWSAFVLLLIYWAENVVVGFFTLAKMLITGFSRGPWRSPFMLTNFVLIVAFHSYLFIWFWLLPGRWRQDKPDEIMASPYGRIIVIHVTILLGGFVTVSLGEPLYMLIVLALLKTAMEFGRLSFPIHTARRAA